LVSKVNFDPFLVAECWHILLLCHLLIFGFVLTRSGEAEAILVNGKSYRSLDANRSLTPEPWTKPIPSVQAACGPEVIEVEPGKTYRMRVIGGIALSMVSFAFQDHQNLSVIAADAGYTQPADTDRIQIGSGQRFDFLLHTKTGSELRRLGKSMFWVQLESRYRPTNVTSYALLSYRTNLDLNQTTPSSPPAKAPLTITNQVQQWLEYTLQPLHPNGFPSAKEVSRQVFLRSEQLVAQSGIFWSVENRTSTDSNQHLHNTSYNTISPSVGIPYLVNVYERGEEAIPDYETAVQKYGGWDPNLNVYAARVGEVIDIILINEPNGLTGGFDVHPWHIHGGHVYDLGSGSGTYNATANEERLHGYNPVLRDTTYLYKYTSSDDVGANIDYTSQGWRAWRLKVENPG
jgi:L-ascorbate oxidase